MNSNGCSSSQNSFNASVGKLSEHLDNAQHLLPRQIHRTSVAENPIHLLRTEFQEKARLNDQELSVRLYLLITTII